MTKVSWKRAVVLALAVAACCRGAWALGTEDFGNAPIHDGNYAGWPGIMPALNHPSRVYHFWVNGNEGFFYKGDTAALNDTLAKFAAVDPANREVVLRPGPGVTHSFNRERTIPYTWSLSLIGGIAAHLSTRELGEKVWPTHPVLTVHVGGDIDLEKIEIPKGLRVVSVTDVKRRTREGLKSTDKTVRGWGTGVLASLDPYDAESRDAIAAMLKDPDNWVRLNAAGALAHMGKSAEPALPALRGALPTEDKALDERVRETIQTIEKAESRAGAEKEHREIQARIDRFVARRKG